MVRTWTRHRAVLSPLSLQVVSGLCPGCCGRGCLNKGVLAKLFVFSSPGRFSWREVAHVSRWSPLTRPGVEFPLLSGEPGIVQGACPTAGRDLLQEAGPCGLQPGA